MNNKFLCIDGIQILPYWVRMTKYRKVEAIMKKIMVVLILLLCLFAVNGALADKGCGNEHYFNCGGGITNDNKELHAPGTNQRFKCYEHVTGTVQKQCNVHDSCTIITTTIYHHYKCMKCTYGSDGSYETHYRTTTVHSAK